MATAIIEDPDGPHVIEKPWTLIEHGVTPEEFDARVREDRRCDYIDEVLYMHSPASMRHEDLFAFLMVLLKGYVEARGLGKVFGSRTLIHIDVPAGQEAARLPSGVAQSAKVPGFWIDVAWLWQNPLPRAGACLEQVLAGPPE